MTVKRKTVECQSCYQDINMEFLNNAEKVVCGICPYCGDNIDGLNQDYDTMYLMQ